MDEPQPSAEAEAGPRRVFVSLIADEDREPSATQLDAGAQASWVAVSAPWHPALLATSGDIPRVEDASYPTSPVSGEVRVITGGVASRIPSGQRTQADDAGVPWFEGDLDREDLIRSIADRLGIDPAPPNNEVATLTRDFLALGTARSWLRELTHGMGHVDCLDHESFRREVLAGAKAWIQGDSNTAASRLRASFELLTQARERIYPLDAYILDLVLLDPNSPRDSLTDSLEARVPFTLIAPAKAIESQARTHPEAIERLLGAIDEGWADVVGGTYEETDESLRPLESVRYQYRKGSEVYRQHLDGRDVETFARRRFGLHPSVPQIARRFSIRYALAMGFDAGMFPLPKEAKKLWEGIDGTALEALTRPPLAADRPVSGAQMAWRLAKAMKEDQVAVVPIAHWPNSGAGWYQDLRRVASYSPVLARWVTLGDFFHLTDRPWESMRPGADSYETPYLSQAVARGDARPISSGVRHAGLRAKLDSLAWMRAILRTLGGAEPESADPSFRAVEELVESSDPGAMELIDRLEATWAASAAATIAGSSGERAGVLVLNPLGMARRIPVLMPPGTSGDLRPEGPLRASQSVSDRTWTVIDLPAQGFAWVPTVADASLPKFAGTSMTAAGKMLRNESIEVEFDTASGGIRSVKAVGEPSARLGQQLVVVGLNGADAQPVAVRMQAEGFDILQDGPVVVRIRSRGSLLDPAGKRLARFAQTATLWTGRAAVELEIELSEIVPELTVGISGQPPWSTYLACRWAWPDAQATLRRTSLLAIESTNADRPETPDLIDISTRKQRTALLFGGLAHHKKHGARMLDTLLIAGREKARSFRMGIAIDQEFPCQAALDFHGPAIVIPGVSGPPRAGSHGWFFLIDSKAVVLTRLEFAEATGEDRPWGVIAYLRETDGRSVRCRIRCVRDPSWARHIDDHGETISDLTIEGDAVLVDLTPFEMLRVEITLG
ncbi:MAG: glycosyl hydrolase family 38 [Isosphaeraceae bacterium]